jgi:uncharacterized DUF497 family protein
MGMIYEWDAEKAAANLRKHGVSFQDAAIVFLNPLAMTYEDPDYSADEQREVTIGHTIRQQLVFVSHCERGDRIRIISARLVTRPERKQYEKAIGKHN